MKKIVLTLLIAAVSVLIGVVYLNSREAESANRPEQIPTETIRQTVMNVTTAVKQSVVKAAEAVIMEQEISVTPGIMQPDDTFEQAKYIRTVDGDTIIVSINGEEKSVRLIGINTPESVAPKEYLERSGKENTAKGKDASEYTKALMKDYTWIYLQKDKSDTDRYDRLLRYVWLEKPDDKNNAAEIANKMLNGILVKNGIAEVVPYKPDTYYNETFEYIREMSINDGFWDGEY